MAKKKALLTGISGQDGSYLAELLLENGYEVYGITRRSSSINTQRLDHLLFPDEKIKLIYGDLTEGIENIIYDVQPDFIYNMAAMSHVRVSFDIPVNTLNINALGPARILEAIRRLGLKDKTRYYQASSSEMFGMSPPPQDENTPFHPCSPYGVAKVAAYWLTRTYRDGYGLFASNGVLHNHECLSSNTPVILKNKNNNCITIKRICDIRKPVEKHANIQQWAIPEYLIWDGADFVELKLLTASRLKSIDKICRIINTRNGIVEVTDHHNMFLEDSTKLQAGRLEIGQKLLHKTFPDNKISSSITIQESMLLGLLVGDGWINDRKGTFSNKNSKLLNLCNILWKNICLGYCSKPRNYKTEFGNATFINLQGNNNYLDYLRNQLYTDDGYKKVPDRILNGSKKIQFAFLRGYNYSDGLKKNACVYEFKNFKTDSILLAQGLLYLFSNTTKQKFTINFEKDEKYYGYYNCNLLSNTKYSLDNSINKYNEVNNCIDAGISQREICRETGISRTFIRKVQNGYKPDCKHNFKKDPKEIKKIVIHEKQPEWVFDIETGSGKVMAGVGNIVVSNSPRRGETFVTKKIVRGAVRIKLGKQKDLVLGNLKAKRDWGHSKDYMRAVIKILEHYEPDDFLVATGDYYSIEGFVEKVFDKLGMDWKDHVKYDAKYTRPKEVPALLGNPEKIKRVLGWEPKISFDELVDEMVNGVMEEESNTKGQTTEVEVAGKI